MDAFFQPGGRAKSKGTDKNVGGSKNAAQQGPAEKRKVPWVEKYRPKVVDDVVHQDEVVSVLKKTLTGFDFPNLLFYGPPGTGKTSAILAIAHELFGKDLYKSRILELNASDDRGIQVIRDKVKSFARHSASASRPDGKPCPSFKIVILDEADSMTQAAQAALRRTMEKESTSTRFCLICNYISRIIEPLTSRCSKFRFKPLSSAIVRNRLEHICREENVKCNDKAIDRIIETSDGDMRKATTFLQSGYRLKGDEEVNEKDIMEIAGVVPQSLIEGLLKTCSSNSYDQLETAVKNFVAEGFPAVQIMNQLNDVIITHCELNDLQKSAICEHMAVVDRRLSDGADEYLQLLDISSFIMTQFCQAT